MTFTSRISKGLNLIAFPYQRAQKYRKNSAFFHSKALGKIWTCHRNWSGSTKGHNLCNFRKTRSLDATYQVSKQSAQWFWRRKFYGFSPYMGMAAILAMQPGRNIYNSFSPLPGGWGWNLNEIDLVVSEEKCFENVDRQLTSDLWPRSSHDLDL